MLFENNNKAVIDHVAKQSFKGNRTRNVVAVTAIALTAFLFTSVFTIGLGAGDSIKMSMAKQVGSRAEVLVQYMDREQFEKLGECPLIETIGCWAPIGFMTNTHRVNAEIDYADGVEQELQFLTPEKGRAPQKAEEVLVSSGILSDMGVEERIGAELPVEFTLRGQNYHFDMVVSGIYRGEESRTSFVIVSEAFFQEHDELKVNTYAKDRNPIGTYTAGIIMRDSSRIEEQLSPVIRELGGEPDDRDAANYVRIAVSPVSKSGDNLTLMLAVAVFGILFVFCGYLLIYNVFDISVINDIRQYGLLRTLGTTSRQIKRLVNRQAAVLSLIGIPIGLCLGVAVGRLMLPLAMRMFAMDYGTVSIASLPYVPILSGAAAFTALTVLISTGKPARKAARVSAMEAVRYGEQENISIRGKRPVDDCVRQMARRNLQRNRRRTSLIVVSLMLSAVLLNSVVVFVDSVDETVFVSRRMSSDFWVTNTETALPWKGFRGHDCGLPEQVVCELESRPEVRNGARLYRNTYDDSSISCYYGMDFDGISPVPEEWGVPEDYLVGYTNEGQYAVCTPDELPLGLVYGAEENMIDRMDIIEGEQDKTVLKEKWSSGKYVILMTKYNDKGELTPQGMANYYDLEIGDPVQFYEKGELTDTFTVAAKAAGTAEMMEAVMHSNVAADISGPVMYMSAEHFKEIYETPTLLSYSFDAEEQDREKVEEYLTGLLSRNPDVTYASTKSLQAEVQSIKDTFLLVGGLIGAILALVGILNFVNVTITNIITRRREFAAMESIGMTKRQLRRLVTLESLNYVVRTAISGIAISGILGITLVRAVVEHGPIWYTVFRMTLLPAILIFAVFALLAVILPNGVLRVFNRGSVVERLRYPAGGQ